MDENSREGETLESAENPKKNGRAKEAEDRGPELESVGVKIKPVSAHQAIQSTDRARPSLDDSGTSSNGFLASLQKGRDAEKASLLPDDDDDDDDDDAPVTRPPAVDRQAPREENQQRVRLAPTVEQPTSLGKPILGPPPSYSFVMSQKSKLFKTRKSLTPVNERAPPPTYSGMQRLYLPPDENQANRFCSLPSFSEPMWRSHSQPALCPRCGIIILTTTHSHDSVATHVAALALCLFGCWPCCLLPYCMNACKNTYHHCPICQTFLGSYSPW